MSQNFNRRTVLSYAVGTAAGATFLASLNPSRAAAMQFKADLKGASEVPPTTSAGTGSLTASYDPATKTLTWNGTFSGLTSRQKCRRGNLDLREGSALLKPVQGFGHFDRCPGGRPGKGHVVCQRPHRRQSGRRAARTGHQGLKQYDQSLTCRVISGGIV